MIKCVILFLILTASITCAQAQSQMVINSADWVDVYSSAMYANLKGMPYNFAINEAHARALLQYLDKGQDIYLVESEEAPYISGYRDLLTESGFTVVNETRSKGGKKLNLELAGKLNISRFILVDDEYGYNAISVSSYAVRSGSWVLFADRDNIDDIYEFLSRRNAESVLIYGHVDREVDERLNASILERIDNGNRFDDNIAITSKFMDIAPSEDIILTNGDFIEATLMSGESPVMFIGADTVPSQVIDYLKSTDVKLGTVIGNDLINSVKVLKDSTGIKLIIKFGQGRQNTGGTTFVEDLDKFYLPKYELKLDVLKAQYNEASKQLELIYRNDAKLGEYYRTRVTLFAGGKRISTLGDEITRFIEAGSESGIAYSVDLTEYARTGNLLAAVSTEFGEAPGSLNMLLKKELAAGIVSVQDNSEIRVSHLVYDTSTERIRLMIDNTGRVAAFASPTVYLVINGKEEVFHLGNAVPLAAGEMVEPSIRIQLSKADLAENPGARVHIAYGERANLLIKSLDETLQMEIAGDQTIPIIAVFASALVLLGIIIRHRSRTQIKKAVCEGCAAEIAADAKFCPKCGKEVG